MPGRGIDVGALEAAVGVPLEVVEATPHEQLRGLLERTSLSDFEVFLREVAPVFGPPRRGTYVPPGDPPLDTVDEVMDVQISASPDVGWTVLRDFLARGVKRSLTVGIYQFTAPHVYRQLRRTMLAAPNATLAICRQSKSEPIAAAGSKADDLDGDTIVERLHRVLGSRFDFVRASTGSGGAFTNAYHIKVAVADEQRFWLSSGNWQSSNQSPYDPVEEPDALPSGYDRSYNREYHAVVEHSGLARVFEGYLDFDRELPGSATFAPVPEPPQLLLPPELDGVTFAPTQRFAPLHLESERVRVTPVLTPDNYSTVVTAMLKSAKRSIDLQNQYINLNPSGNLPEFETLLEALLERATAGVRVRVLLRDFMEIEKIDMLVAMGFDRSWFRLMKCCHAKLIVVDRERALLGSHNWSNAGTVTNRDASLLFEHAGIAEYLGDIFEHDWTRRGRPPRAAAQPRVVRPGDTFYAAAVPWDNVYDEPPRQPMPASPLRPESVTLGTSTTSGDVTFGLPQATAPVDRVIPFGVHGSTGERLFKDLSTDELANRIRRSPEPVSLPESALRGRRGESYDLPFGTDPNNLKQAGWAVLWGSKTSDAVKKRLDALLDHRRGQMSHLYYREIVVDPKESVAAFLARHKVAFGTQIPTRLPYYLIIVASPEDIPFDFQYGLDLEYAVGRLWFEHSDATVNEEAFEAYARAVVDHETTSAGARPKRVAYWGPKHAGDGATALSASELLTPLATGSADLEAISTRVNADSSSTVAQLAKRDALLDLLTDPKGPAVVFTAGHGMGFDVDDPNQRSYQGALLAQDFSGFGSIARKHYLAGEDILDAHSAAGLVGFLFACFGAGTPATNSYPDDRGLGTPVATRPFVAALPQRLLARGALAVIGHVDVAWGFSFRPLETSVSQLVPFENVLGGLLSGERVGHALRALNNRAMRLASDLIAILAPGAPPVSNGDLAAVWIQHHDARAYVLLGDPAARLTFAS